MTKDNWGWEEYLGIENAEAQEMQKSKMHHDKKSPLIAFTHGFLYFRMLLSAIDESWPVSQCRIHPHRSPLIVESVSTIEAGNQLRTSITWIFRYSI